MNLSNPLDFLPVQEQILIYHALWFALPVLVVVTLLGLTVAVRRASLRGPVTSSLAVGWLIAAVLYGLPSAPWRTGHLDCLLGDLGWGMRYGCAISGPTPGQMIGLTASFALLGIAGTFLGHVARRALRRWGQR